MDMKDVRFWFEEEAQLCSGICGCYFDDSFNYRKSLPGQPPSPFEIILSGFFKK